jgi:hypothetical protein
MTTSHRRFATVPFLALAFLALAGTAAAQEEQTNVSSESAAPSAEALAIQDFELARQLAVYGQRTGTAEPFLAAARILAVTPYHEPGHEPRREGGSGDADKPAVPVMTANAMLAAARELADGDEALLAVAAEIEGSMTKGLQGGPGIDHDRVEAGQTVYYSDLTFIGGELAIIDVQGDGDTDLDCWVYDENGNLIEEDTDYTDHCILRWTPSWTGPFELVIKNYGDVWNAYVLTTN